MDFENLGKALVSDTLESSDLYHIVKDDEEGKRPDKSDLEKAKGFLSTVHPRLNISLYDHLADVIKTVLRSKVPNAVDKLEELSVQVKKMRQKADSDLTEVFEVAEELQKYMAEKQIFYKFKTHTAEPTGDLKTADDDDEADFNEEDEEDVQEAESKESLTDDQEYEPTYTLPDLAYIMHRFGQAGIGLSPEVTFELAIAMKDLAIQFKLHTVKFWGKVFGIHNDYFVAEAPYQEGIVQEMYGLEKSEVVQEEELEEKDDKEEEEENEDEKNEDKQLDEDETEEAETEKPKIPPVPEPRQKVRKRIPPEANGTGVNQYLYFVCSKIGQPWRVLPFMTPSQVSEARHLKRFFTGDLESQIRGGVSYPGKEAHYLRAQIARITSSTYIAPVGYYKKAGETDEDDENGDEDEEMGTKDDVVLNLKFEAKDIKYLYSEGLGGWCHYRRAVLDQGRCIPMKLEEQDEGEEDKDEDEDEEENEEEEQEPEILEAIVETEVPVLRSLEEDRGIGGLKPWSIKLSSKLIEEKAVLIMCSNTWPGAYTFYDGKNVEHIYIGYGFKYTVFHYAPPIRFTCQREYEGEELVEDVETPKYETEEEDAEGDEKLDENEDEEKEAEVDED